MLSVKEWKEQFLCYCRQLVDPANDYADAVKSAERINKWHSLISSHVANDTGEDMTIRDHPASWGQNPELRVLDLDSENNFFRLKAASIE